MTLSGVSFILEFINHPSLGLGGAGVWWLHLEIGTTVAFLYALRGA